jgi:hypothetical protein
MSDSKQIERTIRAYFAAGTQQEIAALALSRRIEMNSPMLPEPLHGDTAVREYVQQFTPFISRSEVLEIIIDRNSVAARVLIVSGNGVELEAAFFFRIFRGQISRIRSLFDTRLLLAASDTAA